MKAKHSETRRTWKTPKTKYTGLQVYMKIIMSSIVTVFLRNNLHDFEEYSSTLRKLLNKIEFTPLFCEVFKNGMRVI